jgi:hypothetical protein
MAKCNSASRAGGCQCADAQNLRGYSQALRAEFNGVEAYSQALRAEFNGGRGDPRPIGSMREREMWKTTLKNGRRRPISLVRAGISA